MNHQVQVIYRKLVLVLVAIFLEGWDNYSHHRVNYFDDFERNDNEI